MQRNRWLVAAGALAVLTAAVHTVVGTQEIQTPLLTSAIPRPVALLLYACWHLVSVSLCLSAWVLVRPTAHGGRMAYATLARAVGVLWVAFGLVFVVVALVIGDGPSDLLTLPQWVLLLPVGALALFGSERLQGVAEHGS